MDDPRVSNLPEFSVSEISGAIKRTLEGEFGRVRVRGEITEMKRYPSGHIYFSLKDESAKLSGIVWKNAVPRLGLTPENGVRVRLTDSVPLNDEEFASVADGAHSLIREQVEMGVAVRMAVLEALARNLPNG